LHSEIEETQYVITEPCAEVWEEKKLVVGFPGNKELKPVMERHLAILRQNHPDGCLSCQYGTAKNPQKHWRLMGTGAPPPDRHRQPTPEPMPPVPGSPPMPPGNNARAQRSQIGNSPYSHTSYSRAGFFTLDAYAEDGPYDTNFDPDMLTDEGTSPGHYTIRFVIMQLTAIWMTRGAY